MSTEVTHRFTNRISRPTLDGPPGGREPGRLVQPGRELDVHARRRLPSWLHGAAAGTAPCARPRDGAGARTRHRPHRDRRRRRHAPGCSPRRSAWTPGSLPAAPAAAPRADGPDDADLAVSSEEDEAEAEPADRPGRARPRRRLRRLRPALRPLPRRGLPLRLLPRRLGGAGRGPDLGVLLPGAAQHGLVPLAGQGLRRLADDHRPQPHHRPLQGRAAPGWSSPPRT